MGGAAAGGRRGLGRGRALAFEGAAVGSGDEPIPPEDTVPPAQSHALSASLLLAVLVLSIGTAGGDAEGADASQATAAPGTEMAGQAAGSTAGTVTLLTPGQFHAEEVDAVSGSVWLALYPADGEGGPHLGYVTVRVERVFDAIVDPEGEATGKRVSVAGDGPEPLLLLNGAHDLRPGPVTAADPSSGDFSGVDPMPLYLQGRSYELGFRFAGDELPPPAPAGWRDAVLVLRHGDVEQTLYELQIWTEPETGNLYFGNEGWPGVLWAGDLDRDGRLDLFLDLTEHYTATEPTLFLSSAAGAGELVGRVASHMTAGC